MFQFFGQTAVQPQKSLHAVTALRRHACFRASQWRGLAAAATCAAACEASHCVVQIFTQTSKRVVQQAQMAEQHRTWVSNDDGHVEQSK
jgi:hypothetical protein